jgi:hypothetical protein
VSQDRLPGMPGPSPDTVHRQEQITIAFIEVHRALAPVLEMIPGKNSSISLTRTVSGDRVTVSIKPGADK